MSTPPGVPSPNGDNNTRADKHQKTAEDLWNQAIQHLSEDDQQRLARLPKDKLGILNAVLEEVEAKKQRCLEKRWKYKGRDGKPKVLRDLCDKAIAWVTKFKEVGDTFVKFDVSGHAAMPWAGVSFLLQVASNESQTFGRMLESVERISFLITRYALVDHAYFSPSGGSDVLMDRVSSDEKSALKRDMVMLYSSILEFLAKMLDYYSSNTARRAMKGVIETPESAVDDFLDDITSKEDEISRTQHLLQQTSLNLLWEQGSNIRLTVEHLLALEGPINRVAAQLSDIQDRLNANDRTELLKWLSKIPHEEHHKSQKSGRLDGSGKWLLRNPDFLDWERSSSSSILWVHGMPGCGKSYLLSCFVDHVTKKSPSQQPLSAFFYCSRNAVEPQRGDAASIMRSLLKQLCSASADEPIRDPVATSFKERKKAAEHRGHDIEPLSLEKTTIQIIDVLSFRQDPAFIILDALDECNVDSVHDLLDALEQILQEASGLTKIFVTSRDDGDIRNRLEGTTNVYIDASKNSDDINRFIVVEVDKAISRRRLLGGRVSPSLKDKILATLMERAGGMFRWVSLQLDNICNSRKFKIPEAVQDQLGKLPATLKESYNVIYNQILNYDDRTRRIVERAISLLLTLKQSLSNEAFLSAVCAGYDEELDEMTLLDICCNLITCDTGFGFVHLSAREFVLQRSEYSAAHLRDVVPARACLFIFVSPQQPPCPHGSSLWGNNCWVSHACRYLGRYLSILDTSLAAAPEASIEESVRSMIGKFLRWQPDVNDSPFRRWRESAAEKLKHHFRGGGFREQDEFRIACSHPLYFIHTFNLKVLPVQAGILVPRNGNTKGDLPQQFWRPNDSGSRKRISELLEKSSRMKWYLFLAVYDLYIAEDIAPSYALSKDSDPAMCKLGYLTRALKLPQLVPLKSVHEVFKEFLEVGDDICVEIALLSHPDLKISFDMLDKACSKSHLRLETRRDLLSRYLRQNYLIEIPNLDMADGLDIIQLVVEREPELTGKTELLLDIWRGNSDTWKQKSWPLMDLLLTRNIDLDLNERFIDCISTDHFQRSGTILSPDRERFLTLLLRQPESSVRVDEHSFECLVANREKAILKLVSSLRPHTSVNKNAVLDAYEDGYWPTILMHPCPSASLKDLAIIVITRYPPDAVGFFLSRHKNIRIDDDMLSAAVARYNNDDLLSAFVARPKDDVDIFRLLVDSGRWEFDQVSHNVLLTALRQPGSDFFRWAALFLAREWVAPEDDIFRMALKHHFENDWILKKDFPIYSFYLREHGITVMLSDICNGVLLDLRISQLDADAEATVDRYLEFCARHTAFSGVSLMDFEKYLFASTPHSLLSDSSR